MRQLILSACLLAVATPVLAAEVTPPTIAVIGSGRAERLADYALLNFSLRGEGATSPDAVKALAAVQAKLDVSLPKLPGKPATEARSSNLQIREVRGKGCENRGYGNPQLTAGDCVVVGYIATQTFQLRVTPATKAATRPRWWPRSAASTSTPRAAASPTRTPSRTRRCGTR